MVATETGKSGALEGLRVVDFGQYLAGPQTAMILADHGAEVVRIDPPGGPRWDHPANAILQRGKRSLTLDLKSAAGLAAARDLVARADVVIENFRPGVMARLGLGSEAMCAGNDRLVYCSLPGFGHDDPRAGLPGWEGVVGAAAALYAKGGNKLLKASGMDWPEPVFNPLPLASSYATMIAVNSILAALIARERSGLGQAIEVPLFDAAFEGFGLLAQALPPGTANAVIHHAVDNVYRCADGRWIYLSLPVPELWARFSGHFMPQDWFDDGFADPVRLAEDPAMAAAAIERMAALFATRPAAEWDALARTARIPFTICQTTPEWLGDEQAAASGAVIALDDPELGPTRQAGFSVILHDTPARVRGPRAAPGADNDRLSNLFEGGARPRPEGASAPGLARALDGIKVVDLSHFIAGPTSTRILAEFGAEVLKVDGPMRPVIGMLQLNSGKRTALIDLKRAEGRNLLWPHVEEADVFVQSFARDAIGRLGFAEEDVRARNPEIIYASESCYGLAGPRGGWHGVEGVGQTRSGMALRWGGGTPKLQRFIVCDYASGHLTAMAVLLGLYHRATGGRGQHVEATLMQAATYHQLPFALDHAGRVWDEPAGPEAKGWGPADRLFRAADDWFYVAAPGPGDRKRLRQALSLPADLGADALEAALEQRFASEPVAVWTALLAAAGIAAHRLVEFEELLEDPLVRARGLVVVRDHPGIGPVRATGPVPRLSRTPVEVTRPVGPPGHDSAALLGAASADERAAAVAAGVIADRPAEGVLIWL